LSAVDRERDLPPHVLNVARELRDVYARTSGQPAVDRIDDETFRRAVLAAYPDRVARRRAPRSDRFLLATCTGARLARESGVHDAEFVVAVEVTGGTAQPGGDALIRLATSIEREWLLPTTSDVRHELRGDSGVVRATQVDLYDAIAIGERPAPIDPDEASRLVDAAVRARGATDADARLLRRLRFAGVPMTFEDLVPLAVVGARSIDDVDIGAHVPHDARRKLETLAPAELVLPSGRRARVDYRDDGRPVIATRLQDVFGLNDTPRLGPGSVPVTFELLAPNGRPVQVTSDLRSFWAGVYPELKPALRARYPKHRW
jgi:ATP-dependent helicase HrpB